MPLVSFGNAAHGVFAFGNLATGIVTFGVSLSVGVVAIGVNAIGVVAIGLNAIGLFSFSLINGLGPVVIAGVNGLGGIGHGYVNNGLSPGFGYGFAVAAFVAGTIMAWKRPEKFASGLPEATARVRDLETIEPGEYVVHGALRRDGATLTVDDVALPDPGWIVDGDLGRTCAVRVRVVENFTEGEADYREAAKRERELAILVVTPEEQRRRLSTTADALYFAGRAIQLGAIGASAVIFVTGHR